MIELLIMNKNAVNREYCDMKKHSRFQRDTHYNIETNIFNYNYEKLPFEENLRYDRIDEND